MLLSGCYKQHTNGFSQKDHFLLACNEKFFDNSCVWPDTDWNVFHDPEMFSGMLTVIIYSGHPISPLCWLQIIRLFGIFFPKISFFVFFLNSTQRQRDWRKHLKYIYKSSLISLSHVFSSNHVKRFNGNVIYGPLFKYDNVQVFVNWLFLSRLTCP